MTDSQIQLTDQPLPSCDQLEKIVQSLGLLIEMQSDRDERQTHAFDTIMNQLDSLQGIVDQLASTSQVQTSSEPESDDSLVKSICAKYGLGSNDESSQNDHDFESDHDDSVNGSSEVESVATVETVESVEQEIEEQPVREIPPMDLEEINAIKQKLHEKLREAEIELSVRRANLSQREAVLEEKEARLRQDVQRKMILSSDVDGGPSGNTMLSRLKVHLREFTAAKMGKSNQNQDLTESEDVDDSSQADNATSAGN